MSEEGSPDIAKFVLPITTQDMPGLRSFVDMDPELDDKLKLFPSYIREVLQRCAPNPDFRKDEATYNAEVRRLEKEWLETINMRVSEDFRKNVLEDEQPTRKKRYEREVTFAEYVDVVDIPEPAGEEKMNVA